MLKFKIPLQKDILQVGEVMVILAGDTSCHRQGLRSAVYALVIMQNGKAIFLLIMNGDRNLARDIEERLVPGHGEEAFWILNYLDIH